MNDLVEACSKVLRENQGIDSGVSERTVRDDIRIMRSDILGFNAPIKQRFGYYSYTDPTYSIFGVSVDGRLLLGRILEFIIDIREEVKHPGMEEIVKSLEEALKPEDIVKRSSISQKLERSLKHSDILEDVQLTLEDIILPIPYRFKWSEVLEAIQ